MAECNFSLLLSAYYDGELAPPEAARVERHLMDCAACSAELEQMGTLSAAFAMMPIPPASPVFIKKLESQDHRVEEVALARFVTRLTGVAAAAAILAFAVGRYTAQVEAPPRASTGLAAWERTAIDPVSPAAPTSSLALASADDAPFDEFMARDLGGEQ